METTNQTTEQTKPNIATMDASQLEQHIKDTEQKHRAHLRALRALFRARQTEEENSK